MERELHPVPLSLVVAEFGRRVLARVGADGDKRADKEGSEGDKEGSGEGRRWGVPWEPGGGGEIWGGALGLLRLPHWRALLPRDLRVWFN